jgi:hypothetical protein
MSIGAQRILFLGSLILIAVVLFASEVEVHGPSGDLVAVTGRSYGIADPVEHEFGPLPRGFSGRFVDPAFMDPM